MNRTAKAWGTLALAFMLAGAATAHAAFTVSFGASWDGASLQELLDAEYGVGAVDVASGYEGCKPQDMDPPYWRDNEMNGWLVREIAGFRDTNIMGWYKVDCTRPHMHELRNQVIFDGATSPGATVHVTFPCGTTKFGFYLNPNGEGDSANAPEPEVFFTNRYFNDSGPGAAGSIQPNCTGDPQCLIYNVTPLRGGVPSFVLAWEDLDSGSPIVPAYAPGCTDNDYQDLVVEISAASPMPTQELTWGRVKALFQDGR